MTTNELYDAWERQVNQMTEQEKQKLLSQMDEFGKMAEASYYASKLRWDRALVRDDSDCVKYDKGDYHVYMWLHADGTPFYVGSGKEDRWKNASCRNERFFEETKKLDTLVCKLVDGLSKEQSREAEFCLSHYLSYNGYQLANWDNNYQRSVNEQQADRRVGKFARLMMREYNEITVEQAKKKMKPFTMPCDYDLILEQYELNYGIYA